MISISTSIPQSHYSLFQVLQSSIPAVESLTSLPKSEFVLLNGKTSSLVSAKEVNTLVSELQKAPSNVWGVAARLESPAQASCGKLVWDGWTLTVKPEASPKECDVAFGVLVARKSALDEFTKESGGLHSILDIFITANKMKKSISVSSSVVSKLNDKQVKWAAYGELQETANKNSMKKLVDETTKQTMWFGCTSKGKSCSETPGARPAGTIVPPCCFEHRMEILRTLKELFDKFKVKWWMEGGSLIGALRNGKFIPWDKHDIDLGYVAEDSSKIEQLWPELKKKFPRTKPDQFKAADSTGENGGFYIYYHDQSDLNDVSAGAWVKRNVKGIFFFSRWRLDRVRG